MPRSRRVLFALFLLFLLAYNLFRVALFFMTQNGSVKPDHPLDPTVNAMIVYSELAIGALGLLAVPGLLWSRSWGVWLTVGLSAYAILFDGISAVLEQASAAGGVVPPVVVLLFVLVLRARLLPERPTHTRPPTTRAGGGPLDGAVGVPRKGS
jgi:uncharacterized membrane protein YfcA